VWVADYIAALPHDQRRIAEALLPIIDGALPGAGAVWHGHPVWSLGPKPGTSPVCLLKAYPAYLTLGFWRGQGVTDPAGRLEPGTRTMASVKPRTLEDIDRDLFAAWLRQAPDPEA
jgi:hypothetical protein